MTAIDIDIEFERECPKCYGTSAWMSGKTCEACHNTGYRPTGLGETLLEFLERNGIKPASSTKTEEEEGR